MAEQKRRAGDLAPDPEMWEALKHGEGLREILEDFYGRVYQDPRLNHFFWQATLERAIEKQYSFLYEIFTGEKVYFGERPYNAHSWMVISHALYDYREQLMGECLRRYGLPEHLIHRWRSVEEVFRRHIVKTEPRGKKFLGQELPVEGWEQLTLEFSGLCDACKSALNPGDEITYHVRLGHTWCRKCFPAGADRPLVEISHS